MNDIATQYYVCSNSLSFTLFIMLKTFEDDDALDEEDSSFVVGNDVVEYDTCYMGDTMLAEDPIMNEVMISDFHFEPLVIVLLITNTFVWTLLFYSAEIIVKAFK